MGIDAQRSGASELSDRAVEVRRGRIAYPFPSGCPDTPWYARREFWAGQLAEKVHSSAQHDEGDPGVDRPERGSASERSRATPVSPAFWAVQSSPNGRWQSPARPMRPAGCGGTWTAVPRLWRGRGQAGGPSASLRRLDDVHRHRLRRRALHTAPRRSQRGHLYFHHGLLALEHAPGADRPLPSHGELLVFTPRWAPV